jgi:hypothetical protein
MLDSKNIKIGDTVICINNTNNENKLTINNKYTISEIFDIKYLNYNRYFVILLETGNIKYYLYRFKLDIKTIRKNKLSKILSND